MLCCCKTSEDLPPPIVTRSRTSMRVIKLEHFWTVENFSRVHQRDSTFIDSAQFASPQDPANKFFIRLYPNGDKDEAKNNLSLYLNFRTEEKGTDSITVGCKFSVVNRIGLKFFTSEFKHKISAGNGWGYRKYMERSSVLDRFFLKKLLLPGYLPNDELTLHCEVVYVTDLLTQSSDPSTGPVKQISRDEEVKQKKTEDDSVSSADSALEDGSSEGSEDEDSEDGNQEAK